MENDIKAYNTGSIPIIYEICKAGRIREIINELVDWRPDNTKVSPGVLTESLVIAIICGRKPLWKLEEFWKKQDTNYLFGENGIKAEQLNDDAYGRLLDKLSAVNKQDIVGKVSLSLLKEHGETIKRIHLDTTSISVEGEYSSEVEEGEFDINRGHSKDHRPDLKQFKIGAAVQESGLPIMGELLSGNKSDRAWNPEAVKGMKRYFSGKGYEDIIYVGDSATVSSYDSLKELKGIRFISRFPETFKLVKELKEKAFNEDKWHDSGLQDKEGKEKYSICEYEEEIEGNKYRFVVVNSRELRKKKEKTIRRREEKEIDSLKSEANKLGKKAFACEEDAKRNITEFIIKKVKGKYEVESQITEKIEYKYRKKGRPSKEDKKEEEKNYYVEIEIGERNAEERKMEINLEGSFVLITSILDRENYPDIKILEEYKCQNSVELAFKFLKQPVYLGPIFLKNKKRIEALGYIFILVLIIASFFEYKVRKSLKENEEGFPQPRNRTTQRPTVKTILETFENILIMVINGTRFYRENEDERLFKVISWAGFDSSIFLKKAVFKE